VARYEIDEAAEDTEGVRRIMNIERDNVRSAASI